MDTGALRSPGGTEYRRAIVRANAAQAAHKDEIMTAHSTGADPRREKRLEMLQWFQLIGIVVAVAGIFLAIGRRDQTISDLKDIVTRLVEYNLKTQTDMAALKADVENLKARKP